MSAAYDRLVDSCHELASAAHGKGAAISVDKEGQTYVCRVWNPKGGLALIGPNGRNKAEAFRNLKKVLLDASSKTTTAPPKHSTTCLTTRLLSGDPACPACGDAAEVMS